MAMKIKKDDVVRVIAGRNSKGNGDRNVGKEGKVIAVDHKNSTLLVEGVNMITKHTKPSAKNPQGGKVHQEGPIHVSNVMYLHKGKPTRIGFKIEDGKKLRVAKSTGEVID